MTMKVVWLPSLYSLMIALATTTTAFGAQSLPGCPDHCGDLQVPYPFGTKPNCFLKSPNDHYMFFINCTESTDRSAPKPTPYLADTGIIVVHISLDGDLEILNYVAKNCYDKSGNTTINLSSYIWLSMYTISEANKFVGVGCDTVALIEGFRGPARYTTGCISSCRKGDNYGDESCSGAGCCQLSLPKGLENMTIGVGSFFRHAYVWDFNPCGFGFVVQRGKFNMSKASFQELNKTGYMLPIVVNWSIGKVSCQAAKELGNCVCKGNSECVESGNRSGYLCRCLAGYQGNPYHPDGCQDIDECKASNPCTNGTCNNTPGSYNCSCEVGFSPINNGKACSKISSARDRSSPLLLYIPLCASIGFTALVVASFLLFWGIRKRKLIKLKEKFFEQNGGLLLQRRLTGHGASTETTRIYTLEELKTGTNNFHESRILGEGGYGIVYKGILKNNKEIAIKKSKIGFQTQNEQFVNEVIVLMQINHKNVVKLFGCCLETEVPILVYEFIDNRTLFDHIHNKRKLGLQTLSLELRLKVAAETADALAYLHHQTSTPIVHRDVKTANILLDKSYTTKVSDFGASRLIPLDQEHQIQTFVQGTMGYLDPEYMLSSQLTDKSDVYSFGVVLAELLTSRKVIALDEPENDRNLANYFVCAMNENRLADIVDIEIVNDSNFGDVEEVAKIARRCLRLKGEERPSMTHVAAELAELVRARKHSQDETRLSPKDTDYLLGSLINPYYSPEMVEGDQSSSARGFYNMQDEMLHSYRSGR